MKYIVILIMIISFWFLLGMSLTYINNDIVLSELSDDEHDINTSFQIQDSSAWNITEQGDDVNRGSILDMTIRMFTYRVPESLLPTGFNIFLSLLNFMLLLLFIISLYRIINPLS